MGLQSVLVWWITKCGNSELQSMLGVRLQTVATVNYKVCQGLDYKLWQTGLQSALGITKCGRVDYKVHQELQSMAGLQSELVQMPACNKRPHILKHIQLRTYDLLLQTAIKVSINTEKKMHKRFYLSHMLILHDITTLTLKRLEGGQFDLSVIFSKLSFLERG